MENLEGLLRVVRRDRASSGSRPPAGGTRAVGVVSTRGATTLGATRATLASAEGTDTEASKRKIILWNTILQITRVDTPNSFMAISLGSF